LDSLTLNVKIPEGVSKSAMKTWVSEAIIKGLR